MKARALLLNIAIVLTLPTPASAAPPPNDDLAAAREVVIGEEINATNEEATVEAAEPVEPSCLEGQATTGRTLWYRVTMPADGDLVLETLSADVSAVAVLYSGESFLTLAEVGCGTWGRLRATVTAGSTHLLQVGGYNADPGSLVFALQMSSTPPPPDPAEFADELGDAGAVSPPYTTSGVVFSSATIEGGEEELCDRSSFYEPSGTLWLRITAPTSGAISVETDGEIATNVYQGSALNDLVPVRCERWQHALDGTPIRFHAEAGQTYALQLFTEYSIARSATLTIGGVYATPANDMVADATAIAGLPHSDEVSMWGASVEPDEPISPCTSAMEGRRAAGVGYYGPGPSVWYRYEASAASAARDVAISTSDADFPAIVEVYLIDDDRRVGIACPLSAIVISTSVRSFTALPGRTYLIGVSAEQYRDSSYESDPWLGTLWVTFS